MGKITNAANLYPMELIPGLIQQTKGHSALAKMCAATPVAFNGQEVFTFSLDKEIDVVAESGAFSNGGATVAAVKMVPVKVEYGARFSDEFMKMDEKKQIETLKAFNEGFARKLGKGLDIMALHGFNPRSGLASDVIGNNHFDEKVKQEQKVENLTDDPDGAVEAAISLVQEKENDVTGMLMGNELKAALSSLKKNDGSKAYPELAWGNNPGTINGLHVEPCNPIKEATKHDKGLVGDFADAFKWGYADKISLEIIQYGNPDNDSEQGDLKGHGQIYLRATAFIGWGILNPDAFAWVRTNT